MSADNGYVIRKSTGGKYVLQMYFDSAGYPPIEDAHPDQVFDTLEDAVKKHEQMERDSVVSGYSLSEYGLSVHTDVDVQRPT